MFPFLCSGGGGLASPSVTYQGTGTALLSSTTTTFTALAIGTADTNRRVVCVVTSVLDSDSAVTATIGGVSATQHGAAWITGTGSWTALFSAVVPTGTTANVVMTLDHAPSNTARCSTYTVDDSKIVAASATLGENTTSGATSLAVSYSETNQGVTIGGIFWLDSASKTASVSGFTENNNNDQQISFYKTNTGTGTVNATTSWTGSFAAASAVVHFPAATL